MRAALLHRHGDANEMALGETPQPTIRAGEMLIQVIAAGVNPADWQFRRGDFASFLPLQFPAILGWDVAGVIAAIGSEVNGASDDDSRSFKLGDPVFAFCDMSRPGTYAEYVVVRAEHVAPAPRRLPLRHAAAVPLAALTAWHALHDLARIQAGHCVLINAAAGGVGQFAVQLARAAGARVIAGAHPRNHTLLRQLGAADCIDYRESDWSKNIAAQCDLVIDGAGGNTRQQSWQALRKGALMVAVAMPPIDPAEAEHHGCRSAFAQVVPNGARLRELAAMIDAGTLRVTIDSEYPLENIRAAHARSESRMACGKIILNVSDHAKIRRCVLTGAASGIGRATAALLRERGVQVIGIDRHDADVVADLESPEGRKRALELVQQRVPAGFDALILCAGLAGGLHPGEAVVSVNYFGAIEIAEGLQPLLARGHEPRVVIVASSASILPADENLVEHCLSGDETTARAAARCHSPAELAARSGPIYAASKRAVTRWIRRHAPSADWAGAGILLNGVAPGLVRTPMTAPLLATEAGREVLAKAAPRAVRNAAEPEDLALLIAFLASTDNRYMVGQIPFCDGGKEVMLRGDTLP